MDYRQIVELFEKNSEYTIEQMSEHNRIEYDSFGLHFITINKIEIDLYKFEAGSKYCPVHVLLHEIGHATRKYTLRDKYSTNVEEIIADRIAINIQKHFNILTERVQLTHIQYLKKAFYNIGLEDRIFIEREVIKGTQYILNNWLKDFEFNSQNKAA